MKDASRKLPAYIPSGHSYGEGRREKREKRGEKPGRKLKQKLQFQRIDRGSFKWHGYLTGF